MANGMYVATKALYVGCDATVDWDGANIACYLQDTTAYTPNLSTDDFRDDMGTATSTSSNLGSKTTTSGQADAADLTPAFSAVGAGEGEQAYVVVSNSGTAATSPMIVLIDTATGLPVTPNGGDINITWGAYIWAFV